MDLDRHLGPPGLDPSSEFGVPHIEQHVVWPPAGRFAQLHALALPDDPHQSSIFPLGSILRIVGGLHTGPRFRQGALGIAHGRAHRDEIAAVIAIQHPCPNHVVLREATGEVVPVGTADAIHVDVGLDDKPGTDLELREQVLSHADDGQTHLVTEHNRVGAHVPVDAGVRLPGLYDFNVRVTDPHGIMADQQFIRSETRQEGAGRLSLTAEVLKSGAV